MDKSNELLANGAIFYQKIHGGSYENALIACSKMNDAELATFSMAESENWPKHLQEIALIAGKAHGIDNPKAALQMLAMELIGVKH